ncbi:glycogen debranching N-terminal domain-containing protein [Streptomyces sp. NPDC048172]|uniref:glycogen debranching N-terminal domain-containing protein n=1 Tax=Streptomyces sp. NPDC048172 TaxID=3365505 RepID=UPI003716A546
MSLISQSKARRRTPPEPSAERAPGRASRPAPPPRRGIEYQPAHASLICVAAPALVISLDHGQLRGAGLEGFYRSGTRVLSRCQVRLSGQEPVPVQGRMVDSAQARFLSTARASVDSGPDPELTVERLRSADGAEHITVRNAGEGIVRMPLEVRLGTDLGELGAIAVGRPGAELAAAVHGRGLRWTRGQLHATVTARPAPDTSWAAAGVLRWDLELPPGESRSLALSVELECSSDSARTRADNNSDALPEGRGRTGAAPLGGAASPASTSSAGARTSGLLAHWAEAEAEGDDARIRQLFRSSLDDLSALLLRDPATPSEVHLAGGVPWRCALAPAESLHAARMLLPLGTRLAAGTLSTLARRQNTDAGPDRGRIPGTLRHGGPRAAPSCTGIEATLLFPTVLAEAWRWGLPESDTERLLPAAERCLEWMRGAAGEEGYVPDPVPEGPYRCEVQAHAHRAAVLGAGLLDAHGRSGGDAFREWAGELRLRFAEDFWCEDRGGGRPVVLRTRGGARESSLCSSSVDLLDTGLVGGGEHAPGLLDKVRTEQLARLLGGPSLDSGWGLRSLGSGEPGYNPFGHRGGAVRVRETATAVAGLVVAGYEKEACSLLRGLVDAAEAFGQRLPEMYAAEQRTEGSAPIPHPAACRPAAVAAAGAVQALTALAGIRPDVPAGTVAVQAVSSAPLGEVRLSGLRVAEEPFAVRISRLGMAMVEEAADGLQLCG